MTPEQAEKHKQYQVREKQGDVDRLLSAHLTMADAERALEQMGPCPSYMQRFTVNKDTNLVEDEVSDAEIERMRKRREFLAKKELLDNEELANVQRAADLRRANADLKRPEAFNPSRTNVPKTDLPEVDPSTIKDEE